MVEDPVIPNTVQIKTISRYHADVFRSGIGFGPRNLCQNEDSAPGLLVLLGGGDGDEKSRLLVEDMCWGFLRSPETNFASRQPSLVPLL